MSQTQHQTVVTGSSISRELAKIREMVQACIQCGTCSGSCPNEFAMDFTPRTLWRMVIMGDPDTIFRSKTFTLCSACYSCSLRCPRGLPLTEAMGALKQIAVRRRMHHYRYSTNFYESFMDSVRRHGKVREMEFMTLYFMSLLDPLTSIRFTPLGLKLMSKGKLHLQIPSRGTGKLEPIFRKVEELEGRS